MNRLLAVAFVTAFAANAVAAPPAMVILVRHAEKASSDHDAPLSAAGQARAKELARVLSGAEIAAIYTTQYARTKQTAAPLAEVLKLEPVPVTAGAKTFADEMAKRIREQHAGQTILVVGHSNSTVDVMRALGAENPPKIADADYDRLFVCSVGDTTRCVELRYAAPHQP